MKLSELIAIYEEHGDLDIEVQNYEDLGPTYSHKPDLAVVIDGALLLRNSGEDGEAEGRKSG